MKVNAQYNVAKAGSLPIRVARHQRRKMYRAFLDLGISAADTILDIGVTSDRSYDHSNYLEAWYSSPAKITAVGLDEGAAFLTREYPGVEFVVASGCRLPFADNSFDFVHSSAVLEHVGHRGLQMAMMAEARRVARKAVFLTTPNRWFPVEFHTVLPLIHWLPARLFRAILRVIGRDFFASETNLNLLGAGELRKMAAALGFPENERVLGVRLWGLISNLVFVLQKRDLSWQPPKMVAAARQWGAPVTRSRVF